MTGGFKISDTLSLRSSFNAFVDNPSLINAFSLYDKVMTAQGFVSSGADLFKDIKGNSINNFKMKTNSKTITYLLNDYGEV